MLRTAGPTATLLAALAIVAGTMTVAAWPRVARAQGAGASGGGSSRASDEERAAALKARGDSAMLGLRYQEALDAYRESYALTKNPALLYNQARAHQALGDFPAALELLDRFDAEAPAEVKGRLKRLHELIADIRSRVTDLTLRCSVPGARVILGDKVIGTTPLPAVVKTSSGRVKLQVLEEHHQPYTKELELPGGGAVTVDVELVRKDVSAVVIVGASVKGAHVTVDDKPIGEAPVELVVRAGEHKVLIESSGYEPASANVVVRAGERRSIDLMLTKEAPVTARWWFWTGVGVVVLAGVATTVVLLTPRPADSGTISPGQVSAPLVTF